MYVCVFVCNPLMQSWFWVHVAWGDFSFLTNHVFVGPEVAYCLCSIQFHVLLLKFRGKTRCGYFKRVCLGPWRGYLILILTVLVATATRPTFFFNVCRDSLMRVMSVTPAFSVWENDFFFLNRYLLQWNLFRANKGDGNVSVWQYTVSTAVRLYCYRQWHFQVLAICFFKLWFV